MELISSTRSLRSSELRPSSSESGHCWKSKWRIFGEDHLLGVENGETGATFKRQQEASSGIDHVLKVLLLTSKARSSPMAFVNEMDLRESHMGV